MLIVPPKQKLPLLVVPVPVTVSYAGRIKAQGHPRMGVLLFPALALSQAPRLSFSALFVEYIINYLGAKVKHISAKLAKCEQKRIYASKERSQAVQVMRLVRCSFHCKLRSPRE
jgi:hypothetical protein